MLRLFNNSNILNNGSSSGKPRTVIETDSQGYFLLSSPITTITTRMSEFNPILITLPGALTSALALEVRFTPLH